MNFALASLHACILPAGNALILASAVQVMIPQISPGGMCARRPAYVVAGPRGDFAHDVWLEAVMMMISARPSARHAPVFASQRAAVIYRIVNVWQLG